MPTYRQSSTLVNQFVDTNGIPMVGGTLEAFLAGTTTPTDMFSDNIGTSAGSVITLNARGEPEVSGNTINIWLSDAVSYKFTLKTSAGASVWTVDDIAVGFAGDAAETFDTLAELRANTGQLVNRVSLAGHTTVGDGGGGEFWLDTSDTTSADNNGTNIVDAVTPRIGTWRRIITGDISAPMFGAFGGGVADETALLQSAINLGLAFYLPKGTYLLTSSLILKDNTRLYGDGIGATILQEGGESDDYTISLLVNENYNSTTGNNNIVVDSLSCYGKNSTPIPDGSVGPNNKGIGGIYLGYCTNSAIRDCYAKDGWTGFDIAGDRAGFSNTFNNEVRRCVAFNCASYASNGGAGTPRGFLVTTARTKVLDCVSSLCPTGFFMGAFDMEIDGCLAANWTYDDGFYVVAPEVTMSNCVADGNNFGNGFAIAYNYGAKITNCLARGCANMGFRIHSPQHDSSFTNCHAEDCGYGFRTENSISFTPVSVTAAAGVVTVTLGVDVVAGTLYEVSGYISISGVAEAGYNGIHKITGISGSTLTYTSADAVTSPASGTIVADYCVYNVHLANIFSTTPAIDGIQIFKSANLFIDQATVKTTANSFGVSIFDSRNVSITNSYMQDTFKQAVTVTNCRDVALRNIHAVDCKTQGDTTSNRGVISFSEVQGINIDNVTGSTDSVWWIAQSSAETTPSIGTVTNSKRTDNASIVNQTFAGVLWSGYGAGTPNGFVQAGIGSTYVDYTAGASATFYVKEAGTSSTGWESK